MKFFLLPLLALPAAGLVWAAADATPDLSKLPPAVTGTMDFVKDVQPILAKACVGCHGQAKCKAGLRLDCRSDAIKGGNSGAVIKPGDAAGSRLLFVVAGLDAEAKIMPPKPHTPLTPAEIGRLRAWIDQGAKWPEGMTIAATDSAKNTHWAYQPIKRPEIPQIAAGGTRRNAIDAFIQARLERQGIGPAPEADRATLVRRLSLDLTGLPPTPEEVQTALGDKSDTWYEKVVERLLASPHYGERWGRYWLDLARYADSDGFEKDTGRPFAWRWRHWIIEALNQDMPFDQFTIEQLAGDLLPSATVEQKVATGFHRNTLTNREGGVDQEQFRVEAVVDRVNTSAKVWLGQTLNCCQCHDHKYDPFSQREFYEFFAFFNSDNEVDIPALLPGEVTAFNQKREAFDKKRAELLLAVDTYKKAGMDAAQQQWEEKLDLRQLRQQPQPVIAILLTEPKARTDKQKQELAGHYTKIDKKLAELAKAVADHDKSAPQPTKAQTISLTSPRKTNVMIRGDFLRKGVEVEANTPAVLPAMPASKGKKTRLDLARWLVDPANPLTARVTANWVWHKYFGRGIVATLEDFGTQGEKASHPELLDYLASEFMARKWSMKALHRLIVTSATYRQSAKARPELAVRDPLNVWLARQNRLRLEAEIVRDNALAASGLLIRTIGGPSVRPPQPAGISNLRRQCPLGREHRPGPLPPWHVHLVPEDQPVPDAADIRCAGRQSVLRPPRALQHTLAGTDPAQRYGLCRMQPSARQVHH